MVNLGLIGAGGQAQLHAAALSDIENAMLRAVAARTPERAAGIAARHGATLLSVDALFNDPGIDAVIIAAPTDLHRNYATRAFAAGKHVFCESPITHTLAEAEAMVEAAEKHGRHLMAGYVAPFDVEMIDLKRRLLAGDIGTLQVLTSERLFGPMGLASAERHHGDAAKELMTYDLYFLVWAFGGARLIEASGLIRDGRITHAFGRFEAAGARVAFEASEMMPQGFPFTIRMKAIGTEAALMLLYTFEDQKPVVEYVRWQRGKTPEHLILFGQNPFTAQLAHFIAVIEGRAPNDILSGGQACACLALTLEAEAVIRRNAGYSLS